MKFLIPFLLPVFASAAMLPESIGAARRTAAQPAVITDQSLWEEYGLLDSEQAAYEGAGQAFRVAGYRLRDSTGALAAYQWQRAAKPKTGAVARVGNYLLVFDGYRPTQDELGLLRGSLPRLEDAPLPTLPNYLPGSGLAAGSERYVTGPVSLAKFYPGISSATAGFHFDAEAQLADFQSSSGIQKLAIFSYPTNDIARNRLVEFQKLPKAMAKRAGPLVAVILSPPDPNEAEKLLSQVHYQATVTVGHRFPTPKDNVGTFMVNLFEMIGILLVFCALSGLAVGGLRMILRRAGPGGDGDPMISLHLGDR